MSSNKAQAPQLVESSMNEPALFINEKQASTLTGMPESWFQQERWKGGGPPYIKLNRRVLYERQELIEWLRKHRRMSTTGLEVPVS